MAPTTATSGAAQRLTGSCQHHFPASTAVQIKVVALSLAQTNPNMTEPLRIDFGGISLTDVALTTITEGLPWTVPTTLQYPFSLIVPSTNAITTVFSNDLIFTGIIGTTNAGIPAPPYGMISADIGPADLPNGSSILSGASQNLSGFQYAILYLDIKRVSAFS